ncbi:MAG: hypothetical protein WCV83_01710 [Candidatus Magasanikbacteria bacterium]
MNKKIAFLLILVAPFLIMGVGCSQEQPNQSIRLNQPTQPTQTQISYYFTGGVADVSNFCDGEKMDSASYKAAITKRVVQIVTGNLTTEEKIKTTLSLAADAELFDQTYTRIARTVFENGIVTMHSADGWAGSSIFYCGWKPFVEKNLEQFQEVKRIEWVSED